MAIIYGKNTAVDYAAGNLASFGKSYSRMGAAPLDMYEVWYDYDKLVEYASFRGNDANGNPVYDGNTEVVDTSAVTSYVGQKVAYVNETEGKIYHYSIELNGSLKEIGTSPIGDNKSIVVATDGTVSLKGVDALVFEREVDVLDEDGQPTGEKRTENVQFQPLMTKDGLVWVEPSKTTVEGLASLIDGLAVRVSALENDRVTEEELAAAVKAETDRATEAEKALGERIDAIDFVDSDELAEAIKDFATKNYVDDEIDKVEEAIAAIDFIDEAELATALTPYAKTEDVNTALAGKAAADDLTALTNRVNAFLTGEGTEAALDSLQELIAYIDSHDDVDIAGILEDIQGLENKVVLGTDAEGKEYTTVKAYVEAAIAALAIGDYAKASDLADLAARVKTLEDVDNFTQAEFVEFNTTNTAAIATAKQEAIDAAALAVTNAKYATKSELEAHESAAAAAYATKDELSAHAEAAAKSLSDHETAAEAKYATKDELAPVTQTANNAATKADNLETRINDIVATGGEPNAINTIKVNGTALTIDAQKAVDITVPTSITGMDGYSALDARVTKNTNDIAALEGQLGTTNTNVSGLTDRIAALEAEVGEVAESRIDALEGVTGQHTKDIGANTTAITKINTETIPAIQQSVTNEAKARDDADKAILATIGEVESGKTVVEMINAVAGTIDFTPYAKKDDVAATYATKEELAAEAERADLAEKANAKAIADLTNGAVKKNAEDIAAINTLLNTVDSEDTITSLKELALWVEEHDTEVLPVIEQQGKDIDALEGRVTAVETAVGTTLPAAIAAAEAAAKKYTDDTMVKADGTSIINNEGTFSVGAVSTDKLVNGEMTLVLNGGNATGKADA